MTGPLRIEVSDLRIGRFERLTSGGIDIVKRLLTPSVKSSNVAPVNAERFIEKIRESLHVQAS